MWHIFIDELRFNVVKQHFFKIWKSNGLFPLFLYFVNLSNKDSYKQNRLTKRERL